MKDLLLIGGGGHCRSVIDVIEQQGAYSIVGIVDRKENIGQCVLNHSIIACDDELPSLVKTYSNALVTVGHIYDNQNRVALFDKLIRLGFTLPTIVSPLAYVSPYSNIGAGTVVMHRALVNVGASIGNNCILNTNSLVEHDAKVGDHTHISTFACVNGGTVVHPNTFLGSHATTKEYTEIKGFIKAGSVAK